MSGALKRLRIAGAGAAVELLPTKGLSVGQAWVGQRPLFWEPPLAELPEPDALDPRRPLLVNGVLMEGFAWIAGFTGGIELLGPRNWGLPRRDRTTGELLCLHGEAALVPVDEMALEDEPGSVRASARFMVRDLRGASPVPWYERGAPLYRLERRVLLRDGLPGLLVHDTIVNLSDREQTPDWGYHVQLRPEAGAVYRVPSREVHLRGGDPRGAAPRADDHEVWRPGALASRREERGIVHRGLLRTPGCLDGRAGVRTLLRYPDGSGVEVVLPPAPYVLSWFSAGGAGGTEFVLPAQGDVPARPLQERDWNGVGPEIGASALDHDGDVDPEVPAQALVPGESLELRLLVRLLGAAEAEELDREIRKHNDQRS